MASHIERRKFLATLGGAGVTWPLAARAQQPEIPMKTLSIITERRATDFPITERNRP